MNTSVKSSSKHHNNLKDPKVRESTQASKNQKPRNFFSRLNLRFPWLKLATVLFIGLAIILDLLDLTISKLDNLADDFPTAPFSKHVKATERDLKNKKLVALTFDDGPSPETTPRLLDILTEKNTLATFFMLGNMARNYPEIVKRARNEGHEIGSHTMYHQNLIRLSSEAIEADINESKEVFKNIIGQIPRLIRPPYGNFDNRVRSIVATPLVLWSVDPLDWYFRDSTAILETTLNQVKDGSIILMHDIYQSSIDATAVIIDSLRKNGYEFVTISELARERKVTLSPGNSYYHMAP